MTSPTGGYNDCMEFIGDVAEFALKCFVAWLIALWWQAQAAVPDSSLWSYFIGSLIGVFVFRELIRRKGSRRH